MDKPNTPGGGGGPKLPWEEDSGSGQSFGATGVFGTVDVPEEPKELPPMTPPASQPPREKIEAAPVPPPAPALASVPAKAFTEPVVHKVVFGGPADESPTQLIDRIRMVSAERQALVEKPPAVKPGAQPGSQPGTPGSGGFTELLHTLSGDASTHAAPASRPALAPESRPKAPISGFTSLLQTLNAAQTPTAPMPIPAIPVKTAQPAPPPPPTEPPKAAPPPAAGGFTELLRASDMMAPEPVFPQAQPASPWGTPVGGPAPSPDENKPGTFTQMFGTLGSTEVSPPASNSVPIPGETKPGAFTQMFGTQGSAESNPPMGAPAPRPAENKPGTFTQLFGTLGSNEAGAPPPPLETRDSSSSGPGSFTRMLAIEPPSAPSEAAYREDPPAIAGRMDYAQTPERPGANPATQTAQLGGDPFAVSAPESFTPVESSPAAGSVGITRLIQMLDEPAKAPDPIAPPPPVSPAPSSGAGLWTQTFEALSNPGEPAPPAVAPAWTPPPAAPVPPPAPPVPAGPSEFTQILDASRMREIAMRGGANAAESAAAAPQQAGSSIAPPSISMPGYSPPSVQVSGPQLGGAGFSAQAPSYSAQAPSYSVAPPQLNTPQVPGLYAPSMPPISVPQPSVPAKPAEPQPSKLQSFVPLLLVGIIVLLVVILVVVIFMMKH